MTAKKKEFLDMLSRYQGILHKVNLIYFRNKTDREDNFQEIVYQLWKSYPSLRNMHSIGSWIYAVSINTCISKLKKDKRLEYRENLQETADSYNVEEEVNWSESTKRLIKAIQKLDEIDKSLMLLFLEEKTYKEMADILGISKTNVGVRLNRAKEKLRKHLNK